MATVIRGTATVLAEQTYVTVPHGLSGTPDLEDITLQPQDDLQGRDYWPSDVTPTTFRINISFMDMAAHVFGYTIITDLSIAAPTPAPYCTKADVKGYSKIAYTDLGYATDGDFDTFLDSLILLVQAIIENYCHAPSGFFTASGKTIADEVQDYREGWVSVKYYPILSVTKVEYNSQGYGVAPSWTTLSSNDYIINTLTGQIILVNYVPAIAEQSVRVSYVAGYAATPDLVEYVCIQVCSNVLHGILQRKLSPVVRADDVNIKVLVPEAFASELRAMLNTFIRRPGGLVG
jgi:hypothetical protein